MQFRSPRWIVPPVTVLLAGCVGADTQPRLVEGECGYVHDAEVCTWAEVDGTDVVEVGATLPLAAIEHAPNDSEMVWPPRPAATIHLPEQVRAGTGLELMTVFWEPHGHPPAPYMEPHFDFHFHNVPLSTLLEIDCTDERKPESIPAGYAMPDAELPGIGELVGICVPEMGMHALPEEDLAGGEPFTGAMLVGYYEREPVFIEPMITRELLMRRSSFELDVPDVDVPEGVRYPTRFRAEYDAEADAYDFVLSGF